MITELKELIHYWEGEGKEDFNEAFAKAICYMNKYANYKNIERTLMCYTLNNVHPVKEYWHSRYSEEDLLTFLSRIVNTFPKEYKFSIRVSIERQNF